AADAGARHASSSARVPRASGRTDSARRRRRGGVSAHPAAEEHLRFDNTGVADGEQLDVAVTFSGLQLVFVHDEHVIAVGRHYMEHLLRYKAVRGREAPLEERRPGEVVILG